MRPEQLKLESIWRQRGIRDAVAVAALCVLTYAAAAQLQIFDHIYEFIKLYDSYELDELIVVAFVFGFLMVVYTLRRGQDFKRDIHRREEAARRRESSFRLLFDNNPLVMWLIDRETLRFIAVNDTAIECYGYSREQFMAMKITDLRLENKAEAEAYVRGLPEIQNQQRPAQHLRADGTIIQVRISSRILNYEGREVRLAAVTDVTARKLAEDELRRTKIFLDTVIESVPMPIIVKTVKDGRFTLINKASADLHGYDRDATIGKTLYDIFPWDRAHLIAEQDAECLKAGHPTTIRDHTIPTPYGERLITTKKTIIPGDSGDPEYLLTLIDDVTEQRAAEERIAHMAHSDPLTDLPNRAAFNDRLSAALELAAAENTSFAVLCIDLDGFKGINDIYGHAVGDLLLCQIADRLRAVASKIFVSRLGGDEFTIIAAVEDENSISDLTDRLVAAFVEEFEVDGHRLPQALSIGVAIYPKDGADAKTLMNNADAALYRAKANGSGSVQYFKVEMAAQLRERGALQTDLRDAMQKDELRVHYQPQLNMKGEVKGFEALTRWSSATRGMVPPGEFIPLAEESSLILVLGEWVLRQACREAASWDKPLSIAVNVSPIQFRHGDLPRLVHSILMETGLAASRLELEITEGVLIDDFSRALSVLLRLKALGVRIALDDFGKGYSSLSYLRSFTFDKIKIDRSFISDLATNHQSVVIVRTVIGLGRSLNIPVLAEGVETQAQHGVLAHEGCDEVQGYLTGRPLPIEDYASVVGRKVVARERAQAS
jgi:diguanylate cyclase (GGDEF)-like protein/PAS domain S-box-containing protein